MTSSRLWCLGVFKVWRHLARRGFTGQSVNVISMTSIPLVGTLFGLKTNVGAPEKRYEVVLSSLRDAGRTNEFL